MTIRLELLKVINPKRITNSAALLRSVERFTAFQLIVLGSQHTNLLYWFGPTAHRFQFRHLTSSRPCQHTISTKLATSW